MNDAMSLRVHMIAVTNPYVAGLGRATAATRTWATQSTQFVQRNERSFTRVGLAVTAFGALTVRALSKAADASNALNSEMANVATLIPGSTARVLELRDGVQELAVGVGKSTTDITNGLYQTISAFGDSADSVKILETNAQAARAGLAETTDAINLTSAVTKGYGDTTAEAVTQVADMALMTVRLGQTTFPELAASIGRVTPLAAELNVTQEELFATMATATGVTGGAAEVSTQLRGVLQSLMAPSADMTSLLEEQGFATGKAAIEQLGLHGAIQMVTGAAESSGQPLQKYMRSIEGQALALALAGPQAEAFTEKLEAVGGAAGATEVAFREATEGISRWAFSAEQAAVEQEVAMQRIGETVAPVKAQIMGFIGGIAGSISELSPEMQRVVGITGMATSAVALFGGATLMALPRLAALNATLAATGPLGLAASAGLSRMGAAVFGPWGLAIAGATTALWRLSEAYKGGKATGREMAEEIIAASETTEEATRRLNDALDDQLESTAANQRTWGAFGNVLLGPIGALRNTKTVLDDLGVAMGIRNRATEVAIEGTIKHNPLLATLTLANRDVAASAAEAGMSTTEFAEAADAAGLSAEEMAGSTEEAESAFDMLTPSVEAAFSALATGFDPMSEYNTRLADMNAANREAAQVTAAATASQTDSWETYHTDAESSLEAYMAGLDQTLADQQAWHTNLAIIRDKAGQEAAALYAAQGPEFASLHAEIAELSAAEIQAGVDKEQTIRDRAMLTAVELALSGGAELVDATGNYATAAVDELAEKLGVAPGVVEGILDQSNAVAEQKLELLRQTAGRLGGLTGQNLATKLGEAIPAVASVARQYGIDVSGALTPILAAIGDDRSAQAVSRYIRGEQITGLNTGGWFVPGGGPDRDSRLAALTPGEYVNRRRVVEDQGADRFDMLNAGLADIVPRFNVGGTVPGGQTGPGRANLNPQFYAAFTAWHNWLRANRGHGLSITSGWRDSAQQARLYARYLAGTGNLAAKPGSSQHEKGLAIDHSPRGGAINPTGGQFDLGHPVRGEPWHVEPTWGRSAGGGGRDYSGLYGDPETVVPPIPDFPFRGIGESGQAFARNMRAKAVEWAGQHMFAYSGQPAVDAAPAAGGLKEMAQEMLRGRGWGSQWSQFDRLVTKESSWNPNAQNPTSTAYGLGQFLNATWGDYGIAKTSNPQLQLEAMMRYIAGRYGTPAAALAFHGRNNWYDEGGVLKPGVTVARNDTGVPEVIAAQGMIRDEVVQGLNVGGPVLTGGGAIMPRPGLAGLPRAPRFTGSSTRLDPDEYARRVEVNNRLFELGIVTLDDHLSNLERRMQRTVPFSAEWMALFQDRKRLVDDLLDEHMQAVKDATRVEESAFDELNGLLDDRDRIAGQMVEAQARRDDAAVAAAERYHAERANVDESAAQARFDARRRRDDRLVELEERFARESRRIVADRASSLFDAFDPDQRVQRQWANSIGSVTRNLADQLASRETWGAGLEKLRRMGLSEEAISALGLEQLTGESLATVQMWSGATQSEIKALNEGIAANASWAADRAEEEARRQQGAVGDALLGLTGEIASETARVHEEHASTMTEINAEWVDAQRDLHEQLDESMAELNERLSSTMVELQAEMALVGADQSRSYGQALREGLLSEIPGVLEAGRALRDAMQGRREAELALEETEGSVPSPGGTSARTAPLGHHYVLPDGRHMLRLSDQSWYHASGPGQVRELTRLYGAGTAHPDIQANRILGSLVNLFGAGGLERFQTAQIQPRYFHGGGMFTREAEGYGRFLPGEIVAPQPVLREIVRQESGPNVSIKVDVDARYATEGTADMIATRLDQWGRELSRELVQQGG